MSQLRDIRTREPDTIVFSVIGAGNNMTPVLVGNTEKPEVGDVYWLGPVGESPSVYTVKSIQDHAEYIWTWRAELKHDSETTLRIRDEFLKNKGKEKK